MEKCKFMKKILLIGGGGHCKSVIDVIEQQGLFEIEGIIDKPELLESEVLGYPVIGNDSDLVEYSKIYKYALITVGQIKSPNLRIKLFNLALESGYKLPTIISPRSYVSKHAVVGKGSVIMHDVLINANAKIGDNCIINSKALIEHDSIIKSHCHISTGSIVNGGSMIQEEVFCGSNTTVIESTNIPSRRFIGAGLVVKK